MNDTATLTIPDIVILIGYLFIVVTVGLWSPVIQFISKYFRKKQDDNTQATTEDYFLASRSVSWWAIGASLFCSNIGSEHFIGLAGTGSREGITVGYYELSGGVILLLLGFVFVRVYLKSKIFTTPEYIEHRFSSHIRNYLVFLSLLFYIFTKVSVTIYAAGIVFETVLGWNIWISSVAILSATALYTILGGFKAVIYTEVVQTVVLLSGAFVLMILTYTRVGGLFAFAAQNPDKFHFFKPITDEQFPWPGFLFGINIAGIMYWCTDQVIVQRVLCANRRESAEAGCVFAGYLKLLPMFFLVIPGMMAAQLFPEDIRKDSNKAFTLLVVRLMPTALRGLLLASMLSAAMSTLSSVFNSASTVFTMDVYSKIRKQASQLELVWVGRLASLFISVVSVLWIPVMRNISDQLFVYIQSVSAYTGPPIAALFLAGICSKRITSTAALTACIISFVIGMTRFILEIVFRKSAPSNFFIYFFAHMNYLYFGTILFTITMVILLVVSVFTEKPRPEQVENYTIDWAEFWHDMKRVIVFWKHNQQDKVDVETDPLSDKELQTQRVDETQEEDHTTTTDVDASPLTSQQQVAFDDNQTLRLEGLQVTESRVPIPRVFVEDVKSKCCAKVPWYLLSYPFALGLIIIVIILLIYFR